jgi:hypothetical protein
MGIGGAEWLIIGGMLLVLLFVPGAAVFALGYVLGKKSGESGAAAPGPVAPPTRPPVQIASDEPDATEPAAPVVPPSAAPTVPPAEGPADE